MSTILNPGFCFNLLWIHHSNRLNKSNLFMSLSFLKTTQTQDNCVLPHCLFKDQYSILEIDNVQDTFLLPAQIMKYELHYHVNRVRRDLFHTFLCLAFSFPSAPKTQHVLYKRSPERSGIEPPSIVICSLRATSDSIEDDGDASPPASISSAYTGKLSFEYGLFHISWHGRYDP